MTNTVEAMMNANATVPYRNIYGTHETNGLVNGPEYHEQERESVDWAEPGLKITRLRVLTDAGFPMYDVSYCYGEVAGKQVVVQLPFHQIPVRGYKGFLIREAQREGVYAKGLGILDLANWSILK
jgi:hypothetical protein